MFVCSTISHLCVHRRHSLNLKVEKSFVTLHPFDWRDLGRKFLHKKGTRNITVCLLYLGFIFVTTIHIKKKCKNNNSEKKSHYAPLHYEIESVVELMKQVDIYTSGVCSE